MARPPSAGDGRSRRPGADPADTGLSARRRRHAYGHGAIPAQGYAPLSACNLLGSSICACCGTGSSSAKGLTEFCMSNTESIMPM